MTAKERVHTALSRGVPDCVPVIPQICHTHAIKALGMDYESMVLNVIRNPLMANELVFECAKKYGIDGFRAWIPGSPVEVTRVDGKWHGIDKDTGKLLGQVDFNGGGNINPPEEPQLFEEDVDNIPIIPAAKIVKSGKLDSLKAIIDKAGNDFFVISSPGNFTWQYMAFARGKVQAMVDIFDNPEFCHRAQEKALQVAIQTALALAEIGVDGLYLGDGYSSLISPTHFKEFSVPYIKRFVDAVRGTGVMMYLHICGDSNRILDMMADTGVDCIEPLDILAGVQVRDAKERVGKRVALMGGVNTVTLAHGTLGEVVSDCHRCLSEGASGGGYILASADMLPIETSTDKVEAMVEAAHSYVYS